MVGGVVANIVKTEDSVWVQCIDRTYSDQTCAIRVRDAREMKVGDRLWWHGRRAFWTPKPDDGREDVVLERVGYSHSYAEMAALRLRKEAFSFEYEEIK